MAGPPDRRKAERPPKVRRIALRECARVLKPGARLVLLDSLQHGDQHDYEGLLELFPGSYHEPYYSSYIKEDFGSLASECDLKFVRSATFFLAKVMVFDKPRPSRPVRVAQRGNWARTRLTSSRRHERTIIGD